MELQCQCQEGGKTDTSGCDASSHDSSGEGHVELHGHEAAGGETRHGRLISVHVVCLCRQEDIIIILPPSGCRMRGRLSFGA